MFIWANWPPEFTLSTTQAFPQDFPNLRPHLCANEVSDATLDYNCIAWAASDTSAWWEPDPLFQYYWPDGIQRNYSLGAYVDAFRTADFEICPDGEPEEGMEKIVIYTLQGLPKHAARRLANGNWTSKLGAFEDIQHIDLHSISGPLYGAAHVYMKRKNSLVVLGCSFDYSQRILA
jgi:hypothetical protein